MVPFLLAAALLAQRGVPALPFPDPPTELELYLGLSKTESRLLQSLTYGTDIQLIELDKADARLADEVLLATERQDIRPLELGPLHVLLERNRRERTRLDAERIRLLKQALSTAQLQRLEGLEQALRLRSVIQSGISFGILPVDCSLRSSIGNPRCTPHWLPKVNRLPEYRPRPEDRDFGSYGRIAAYLGLSPAQALLIESTGRLLGVEEPRMRTLTKEIAEELAREDLDAIGIGWCAAELELLRR